MKSIIPSLLLLLSCILPAVAQENKATFQEPNSQLWLGSYNSFRLSERLFWRAEFHYRTSTYDDVLLVGKLNQIYNRHALNYIVSPNFNFSVGGVLRLNFTPEPGNENYKEVVPEPRIWHEYLFVMPSPRFVLYHRIRIEHRWSKGNAFDAEWTFKNRYRYKMFMKIPLNNNRLVPGTIYFNPDVEIIMQSGKSIVNSPMEDLRLYPSLGYIYNPRVTYTAGMMYTTGQTLSDGSIYTQRWVLRLSAYINLDFRREQKKIPSIRLLD